MSPRSGDIGWASVVVAALGFGTLVYGLTRFAEGETGLALSPSSPWVSPWSASSSLASSACSAPAHRCSTCAR